MAFTLVQETFVMEALKEVIDPELGINVVDLGLIYEVDIDDANVSVTMTLTTPGCPLHESIGAAERSTHVPAVPVPFGGVVRPARPMPESRTLWRSPVGV